MDIFKVTYCMYGVTFDLKITASSGYDAFMIALSEIPKLNSVYDDFTISVKLF